MALPEYDSSSTASFGGGSRREVRRDKRQDRRLDRRAGRRANQAVAGQTDPGAGTVTQLPPPAPTDYNGAFQSSGGFSGSYISPDNSYDHPFYTPTATYARPGEQYNNVSGTGIQQSYIERNPAAGYYGTISQQGYGGLDAKSQAVQGMYKDFVTGYEAAKAYNNFDGNFQSFMGQQNIPGLLEQMTSAQLGIDRRQFDARDRWSQRGN